MTPKALEALLNKILRPWDFRDFCHNGLQVSGDEAMSIDKVLTAVTISDDVINKAIEVGAHAIIVHHGWLWKPETGVIAGPRAKQVRKLLENDISLYAYHLPLDMHEEVGNNVQLMKQLGVPFSGRRFGPDKIVFGFSLPEPENLTAFLNRAFDIVGPGTKDAGYIPPFHLVAANKNANIRNIAVVTGGGQRHISDMIAKGGYDLFISGEVNLPQHYEALENGVAIVGMGHHRTERYGVKALGELIELNTDITAEFYDDGCPL